MKKLNPSGAQGLATAVAGEVDRERVRDQSERASTQASVRRTLTPV